jgi:hypothetical protein
MTDREIIEASECVALVPWCEPERAEFCAGVCFMEKRK